MRVAIVGGGPGGLYLATLLKRSDPTRAVTVLERDPEGASYGFGVVFSDSTVGSLLEGDPDTTRALLGLGPSWEHIEVRLRGRTLRCGGHGFTSLARARLLGFLQQQARAAAVDLRFEHPVSTPDELPDHDLLVGADGVRSTVRDWDPSGFGPRIELGRARFIWLGSTLPLECLTFVFAESEHGRFGVHGYPFEDGTSTFLVETDEATYRAAGLDRFEAEDHPPGTSDRRTMDHLAALYADVLDGHELLGSNSRWLGFPTVRCRRWSHGRTVLVGDAAHTAHFSLGSGTRMAMQDAQALAAALDAHPAVEDALAAYEAARRPQVERIQAAAEPSLRWWERFGETMDWGLERFAFHFLTRTPVVTRGRLQGRDHGFVRRVDRWWEQATGADVRRDGPLAAPLTLGSTTLANRVAIELAAGTGQADATGLAVAGAGLLLVPVASGEDWAGTVADLHERTRARIGAAVPAKQVDDGADLLHAAIVAGFDAVHLRGDDPEELVEAAAAVPPARRGGRPLLVDLPLVLGGDTVDGDPVGDLVDEDRSLALAGRLVEAGADALVVRLPEGAPAAAAGPDRWRQLLVSERVRLELDRPTVLVDAVATADAAETTVLAGRADLVAGRPRLGTSSWAVTA